MVRTRTPPTLVLCALLLALAAPAAAEMIQWVDAAGTVHVSGSMGEIPPEFRAGARPVPSQDERVRIIPSEPEEPEPSGWFPWAAAPAPAKRSATSAATSPATPSAEQAERIPGFSFGQGLVLVVVQFFASILVLVSCVVLIGEKVEHLGGKAFGSIFAQRFLMFAAFLWISHTTTMNFVPQSAALPDLARALITPILAELGIMTVILRYTICDAIGRAAMLSVLFCMVDAMAQGLLLLGAIVLVG